jgi:hypothetical protein
VEGLLLDSGRVRFAAKQGAQSGGVGRLSELGRDGRKRCGVDAFTR